MKYIKLYEEIDFFGTPNMKTNKEYTGNDYFDPFGEDDWDYEWDDKDKKLIPKEIDKDIYNRIINKNYYFLKTTNDGDRKYKNWGRRLVKFRLTEQNIIDNIIHIPFCGKIDPRRFWVAYRRDVNDLEISLEDFDSLLNNINNNNDFYIISENNKNPLRKLLKDNINKIRKGLSYMYTHNYEFNGEELSKYNYKIKEIKDDDLVNSMIIYVSKLFAELIPHEHTGIFNRRPIWILF